MNLKWYTLLVILSLFLSHTRSLTLLTEKVSPVSQVVFISMANNSYRTVYAFAREMHPKTVKTDIQYGTAGFRTKWVKIPNSKKLRLCSDFVVGPPIWAMLCTGWGCWRCCAPDTSEVSAIRVKGAFLWGVAGVIGVMITASHNPEPDNGVK